MRSNCVLAIDVSGAVEGRLGYWGFGQFHDVMGFLLQASIDGPQTPTSLFLGVGPEGTDSTMVAVLEGVPLEEYILRPPLADATRFEPDADSRAIIDPAAGNAEFDMTATDADGRTIDITGTADCEGPPLDPSEAFPSP